MDCWDRVIWSETYASFLVLSPAVQSHQFRSPNEPRDKPELT